MIDLDRGHRRSRHHQRISEKQQQIVNQLNINNVVAKAQQSMKVVENKNYHLAESIRKGMAQQFDTPRAHGQSQLTAQPQRKFDIEQIYLQEISKSQLKYKIPHSSLDNQRDKIKNTFTIHKIDKRFGLCSSPSSQQMLTPQGSIRSSQSSHIQFSPSVGATPSTKQNQQLSIFKDNPNKATTNVFLTNIETANKQSNTNSEQEHILFISPNKKKVDMLEISEPQIQLQSSSVCSSQQDNQNEHQKGSLKIQNLKKLDLPRCRSAMSGVKALSAQQLTGRVLNNGNIEIKVPNSSRSHAEVSTSPINGSEPVSPKELQPGSSERKSLVSSVSLNGKLSDAKRSQSPQSVYSPSIQQSKPLYYIDNNEVQSVKEFMFRLKRYETYKRFEQKRLLNERKRLQIEEVQKTLMERSEVAAKDTAIANVRKYIMKNKIEARQEEIDAWVEESMVKPIEINQRLTYRETNRQIVSFQLKGSQEEREFSKIQKEIDKALNLINSPTKFLHHFAMHMNHKAKNYQQESLAGKHTSTVALINRLPSQYLVKKPPPEFFKQNAQSMNKITSIRLIEDPKPLQG